jgi:hypothetical protein
MQTILQEVATIIKRVGCYILRVLIAFDRLLNTVLLAGEPDQTISGNVGYMSQKTKKWYWVYLEKVINTIIFWQDNHCYESIGWDKVSKERRE